MDRDGPKHYYHLSHRIRSAAPRGRQEPNRSIGSSSMDIMRGEAWFIHRSDKFLCRLYNQAYCDDRSSRMRFETADRNGI
jgi:hypothetical protein